MCVYIYIYIYTYILCLLVLPLLFVLVNGTDHHTLCAQIPSMQPSRNDRIPDVRKFESRIWRFVWTGGTDIPTTRHTEVLRLGTVGGL